MDIISIVITIALAVLTAASIPMAFIALRMLHLIQITLAKMEEQLSFHTDGIENLKEDQERQDKEIELLSEKVNAHDTKIALLNANSRQAFKT